MSSGSRPASLAAVRTALIVHSAIDRSASWRMNPSHVSPISASAFGPYPAPQTSSSLFGRPRQRDRRSLVVDAAAVGELADHVDRLAHRRERGRLAVRDAHGRVAAADAADRAVAVHLVERGVGRRGDGPVAGRRVGDHRPDDDVARLVQDLGVDDVRLLPQDVRVERPDVAEPVGLRPLRQIDDPRRRRRGLQHDADVHGSLPLARVARASPPAASDGCPGAEPSRRCSRRRPR